MQIPRRGNEARCRAASAGERGGPRAPREASRSDRCRPRREGGRGEGRLECRCHAEARGAPRVLPGSRTQLRRGAPAGAPALRRPAQGDVRGRRAALGRAPARVQQGARCGAATGWRPGPDRRHVHDQLAAQGVLRGGAPAFAQVARPRAQRHAHPLQEVSRTSSLLSADLLLLAFWVLRSLTINEP